MARRAASGEPPSDDGCRPCTRSRPAARPRRRPDRSRRRSRSSRRVPAGGVRRGRGSPAGRRRPGRRSGTVRPAHLDGAATAAAPATAPRGARAARRATAPPGGAAGTAARWAMSRRRPAGRAGRAPRRRPRCRRRTRARAMAVQATATRGPRPRSLTGATTNIGAPACGRSSGSGSAKRSSCGSHGASLARFVPASTRSPRGSGWMFAPGRADAAAVPTAGGPGPRAVRPFGGAGPARDDGPGRATILAVFAASRRAAGPRSSVRRRALEEPLP